MNIELLRGCLAARKRCVLKLQRQIKGEPEARAQGILEGRLEEINNTIDMVDEISQKDIEKEA